MRIITPTIFIIACVYTAWATELFKPGHGIGILFMGGVFLGPYILLFWAYRIHKKQINVEPIAYAILMLIGIAVYYYVFSKLNAYYASGGRGGGMEAIPAFVAGLAGNFMGVALVLYQWLRSRKLIKEH
jgi:hypothetical protein